MNHTDPSLEIAYSCYSWFIEYLFFTLQLTETENTMLGLTAVSQSGSGEIKGVPEVLAIKAQALVIRVRYVLFPVPFTNENNEFSPEPYPG
jgi:hypothetical protein